MLDAIRLTMSGSREWSQIDLMPGSHGFVNAETSQTITNDKLTRKLYTK